jgi:hypothetical protein
VAAAAAAVPVAPLRDAANRLNVRAALQPGGSQQGGAQPPAGKGRLSLSLQLARAKQQRLARQERPCVDE